MSQPQEIWVQHQSSPLYCTTKCTAGPACWLVYRITGFGTPGFILELKEGWLLHMSPALGQLREYCYRSVRPWDNWMKVATNKSGPWVKWRKVATDQSGLGSTEGRLQQISPALGQSRAQAMGVGDLSLQAPGVIMSGPACESFSLWPYGLTRTCLNN